jgi:hypothetical protein
MTQQSARTEDKKQKLFFVIRNQSSSCLHDFCTCFDSEIWYGSKFDWIFLNFRRLTDNEARDDSRNCQTL